MGDTSEYTMRVPEEHEASTSLLEELMKNANEAEALKTTVEITPDSGTMTMPVFTAQGWGPITINRNDPAENDLSFVVGGEQIPFLTVKPSGEFVFNHEKFPHWEADDFAREFIKIVEHITKIHRGC